MYPVITPRARALFVVSLAATALSIAALRAQDPASYPHDMSEYGCANRDENACDQAPAPPPDYNPLVGTWVR